MVMYFHPDVRQADELSFKVLPECHAQMLTFHLRLEVTSELFYFIFLILPLLFYNEKKTSNVPHDKNKNKGKRKC